MERSKLNLEVKEPTKKALKAVAKDENAIEDTSQLVEKEEQYGEDEDLNIAYVWLLAFSALMLTFPFITFYGVRSWLQTSYDFSIFHVNCFAVLASVLVVNIIICLYVFKAFTEKDDDTPKNKSKSN